MSRGKYLEPGLNDRAENYIFATWKLGGEARAIRCNTGVTFCRPVSFSSDYVSGGYRPLACLTTLMPGCTLMAKNRYFRPEPLQGCGWVLNGMQVLRFCLPTEDRAQGRLFLRHLTTMYGVDITQKSPNSKRVYAGSMIVFPSMPFECFKCFWKNCRSLLRFYLYNYIYFILRFLLQLRFCTRGKRYALLVA